MIRYEVLADKKDFDAIQEIHQYIGSGNLLRFPEYQNETTIRFEFLGDEMDAVKLMSMGAKIVHKLS